MLAREEKRGDSVKGESSSDKLEKIEKAVGDLGMAHRLFQTLLHLNVRRAGLDAAKLQKHLEYCSMTHDNAKHYLAKVSFLQLPGICLALQLQL